MKQYKLTFELVPEECWHANLRSMLSQEQWDLIRKDAYRRAEYKCRICGRGNTRLEAHEKWSYDERKGLQKLEDVLALCKDCHQVKHISRTQLIGRGNDAMEHFMRVNECTQSDFHAELGRANEEYIRRNKIENCVTDISWLKDKFNF